MRGTRLFFGIFLAFFSLTGSAVAQIKVSADTTKGITTTSKGEAAKSEPSSNAKAAPTGTSAPATTSKTGVSVKASGAAQPAAGDSSSAAVAAEEQSGQTPARSTGEPTEGVMGQTTTSAEADKAAVDSSTYSVRLRDLEQRINELKEQVFRSKARLSLLAETILQGAVSGSQARLIHENRMGSSYLLVKVVYALDGAPIFNKTDEEGSLNDSETFDIYNGSMVPGEHTITANLEYRGRGFGIFSYLKGYRFKVKSSYTFGAPEGKAITVRVVSYEKGGPTAPLEDRPAIRYVDRVTATSSVASAEKGGK